MKQEINIRNKFILINILVLISEFLVNSFATIYILGKGVSYTQMGMIFMLFLLGTTLLEYPSGGLADKFGRKKIYSLGIFLTSVSYLLILSKAHFGVLCLSYFIKGIGAALISGSLEAWLACAVEKNEVFNKILSLEKLIEGISSFVMPILFLFKKNENLDYVFIICFFIYLFLTLFVLFCLKENYGSQDGVLANSKNSFIFLMKNKKVIYAAGINIIAYLFFTIFLFVWQPIAEICKINIDYYPIIYGVYLIASGIAAYIGGKRINKNSDTNITVIAFVYILTFSLFLCAVLNCNNIFLILGMIAFGMGKGVVFMLVVAYTNKNSPNELKASIFSLVNALATLVNLIMQVVFGQIIDLFGLSVVLEIGIALAIIWIILTLISRKDKNLYYSEKGDANNER